MKFKCGKRSLILIHIFFFWATYAKAQTNSYYKNKIDNRTFVIGIATELGVSTKKSPFNYTLGFDIQSQYRFSEQLVITATAGYSRLLTKDTSYIPDYDFLPVTVGTKIFAINDFYLAANVGAGLPIQSSSKIAFIFGGGFGYELNKDFDLSVKFTGYQQSMSSSTYQPLNGMFILRFGYNF